MSDRLHRTDVRCAFEKQNDARTYWSYLPQYSRPPIANNTQKRIILTVVCAENHAYVHTISFFCFNSNRIRNPNCAPLSWWSRVVCESILHPSQYARNQNSGRERIVLVANIASAYFSNENHTRRKK